MKTDNEWNREDPLGLRDLPLLEPDVDGWDEIRQALEADGKHRTVQRRRRGMAWLAMAASLALVVSILMNRSEAPDSISEGSAPTQLATTETDGAPVGETDRLDDLIALSQMLEVRLRTLREGTTTLPGETAVYVAELEDMVARVDGELSYVPESVDLWAQRVNLLLDLESLYQHSWEAEYGRMASL